MKDIDGLLDLNKTTIMVRTPISGVYWRIVERVNSGRSHWKLHVHPELLKIFDPETFPAVQWDDLNELIKSLKQRNRLIHVHIQQPNSARYLRDNEEKS